MGKQYIPVLLHITEEGKVTPKQIKAGYEGEWVRITRVTDSRRRASLRAGAVGIRYTCVIDYNETQREIYLFDEGDNRWFIEIEN